MTEPADGANVEAPAPDSADLDEAARQVLLAHYGMAAPLVARREAQMALEVERIAARYGADDPEVATRRAALESARGRFRLFDTELARTRVRPGTPGEGQAGISGLVLRGGAPIAAATVVAYAKGKRIGFSCTAAGGFFIEVPPDLPILLSVIPAGGGEAFRDREGVPLAKGQSLFRTIDLDRVGAPCPEPAEPAIAPADDSFPMVRLIGQREAQAAQLIAAQGLKLGARHETVETKKAGTVIGQKPSAGAKVKPGQAVEIRVAIDDRVAVPPLIGSGIDDARLALVKGHLVLGDVVRTPVEREKADLVVDQSPDAGARVPRNSTVGVTVGIYESGRGKALDPVVDRVVDLAMSRLLEAGQFEKQDPHLRERFLAVGIRTPLDLDRLIGGDRTIARDKLGTGTLGKTDRVLAALRNARKALE